MGQLEAPSPPGRAPTLRPGAERLDLSVADVRQLFNAMDPAPFRERDLDPNAEAFIVEWARETRADAPLELAVQVTRGPVDAGDEAMLAIAVHEHFARGAASERRRLARLFRTGRASLVIGVAFVAVAIFVGDWLGQWIASKRYARLVEDSLVIGAWVALWRPLEIFLYDWWPIRAEARLLDRLAAMDVRVTGAAGAT